MCVSITYEFRVDFQLIKVVEHCLILNVGRSERHQVGEELLLSVAHIHCSALWELKDSLLQKLISGIKGENIFCNGYRRMSLRTGGVSVTLLCMALHGLFFFRLTWHNVCLEHMHS